MTRRLALETNLLRTAQPLHEVDGEGGAPRKVARAISGSVERVEVLTKASSSDQGQAAVRDLIRLADPSVLRHDREDTVRIMSNRGPA